MPARVLRRFAHDEAGAVTVDWVVLTAGVIALGLLVVSSIVSGANHTSTGVGARLADADVPDATF